jgi:membrane protein YqaA with SNARE-associated domain|tara:strand:- start:1697 stop:2080 length:384 start_codon:yes stop_codon:yes gene_type:complete
MFGYAIGLFFFETIGQQIIEFYSLTGFFETVGGLYAEYTSAAVIIAGFTPIPYKVFTILAGLVQVNFPLFVVASIIGRGGRFFLVAALLRSFGEPMKDVIDRYFNWLTVALAVLFVAGFTVLNLLSH